MPDKSQQEKRQAHYVELEHRFGLKSFFCPVCGASVVDEDEGLREDRCSHVLLVHDWVGDFHTRDEEIEELVEAAVDEAEENDTDAIELLREKFGQNVVFFESFEPGEGSKDASAITFVVDLGMAGATEET